MSTFFAYAVVGVVTGSIYAVAASSLVVTYTASGVFNFASGAIGMIMAFAYWQLRVSWHWPAPLALFVVLFLIAPAFGMLVERFLIRKIQGKSVVNSLVVTIGLMLGLIGLATVIWKPESRALPGFFGSAGFQLGSVFVTWHQTITVIVAGAIAIGLRVLLFRTRMGVAMRAVVDDSNLAGLHGVRPGRVSSLSWALGASLAALAGILIAPFLQLAVLPLTLLVLDAYAAAMVGRLRSLPLTFAGALGLGLVESFVVGYLPNSLLLKSTILQGLRLSIPTIMLFVILLLLPEDKLRAGRVVPRIKSLPVPSLKRSVTGGLALVAVAWIGSGFLGPGNLDRVGQGLAFALVMLSLVPLTGYGGQVSLCQMTFAGVGAYAMVKVGAHGSPLGLVVAVVLASAVGAVVALPALRLRGLYLALSTAAFAVLMDNMFFVSPSVFGFDGSAAVSRPDLFGMRFSTPRSYFVLMAVVFAILSVGVLALRRGPFGRVLSAMKDSEAACATLGLSLTTTKLKVFTLSAGMAGLAGALYGGLHNLASANDFVSFSSLPILLLVVVQGVTTVGGALAGGVGYGLLPLLASAFPILSSINFLGAGLAGLALGSRPDGILVDFYSRLRGRRSGGAGGRSQEETDHACPLVVAPVVTPAAGVTTGSAELVP